MFPCRDDREGRAVLLVYSELTSTPVSVTCSSLLERKAQACQETHHVQARHVLSACACHSCVLHVCVCTSGFSFQRRRDSTRTRETEAWTGGSRVGKLISCRARHPSPWSSQLMALTVWGCSHPSLDCSVSSWPRVLSHPALAWARSRLGPARGICTTHVCF